jgi:hypothetical protein
MREWLKAMDMLAIALRSSNGRPSSGMGRAGILDSLAMEGSLIPEPET